MGKAVKVVRLVPDSADQAQYFSKFVGMAGVVTREDKHDFPVSVLLAGRRLPERFSWAELEVVGAQCESCGRAMKASAGVL